jgi:hypothetical protein
MNVHEGQRRRQKLRPLKSWLYWAIRDAVGRCPLCSQYNDSFGAPCQSSAIYRRSGRSVTMRCDSCGLQWTVTWAQLNKALRRTLPRVAGEGDRKDVEYLIRASDGVAEAEHRGRKPNAVATP